MAQILGKCLLKLRFPPAKVRRVIPNVLAERYASPALQAIWSAEGRIVLEREFWIAVMKAQRDLGLDVPAEAIAAYESVKDSVDPASIMAREKITRHDVKARIEEFNDLAGHEQVHKGMTSRDLTENVEQLQIFSALKLVRFKTAAALLALALLARLLAVAVVRARSPATGIALQIGVVLVAATAHLVGILHHWVDVVAVVVVVPGAVGVVPISDLQKLQTRQLTGWQFFLRTHAHTHACTQGRSLRRPVSCTQRLTRSWHKPRNGRVQFSRI